jgi:hypothetical protein
MSLCEAFNGGDDHGRAQGPRHGKLAGEEGKGGGEGAGVPGGWHGWGPHGGGALQEGVLGLGYSCGLPGSVSMLLYVRRKETGRRKKRREEKREKRKEEGKEKKGK